ncbi:hypothetical protein Z043_110506, partial [Scleropages formosus]
MAQSPVQGGLPGMQTLSGARGLVDRARGLASDEGSISGGLKMSVACIVSLPPLKSNRRAICSWLLLLLALQMSSAGLQRNGPLRWRRMTRFPGF